MWGGRARPRPRRTRNWGSPKKFTEWQVRLENEKAGVFVSYEKKESLLRNPSSRNPLGRCCWAIRNRAIVIRRVRLSISRWNGCTSFTIVDVWVTPSVGLLLREWRQRRRLSQLDLPMRCRNFDAISKLSRGRPFSSQPGYDSKSRGEIGCSSARAKPIRPAPATPVTQPSELARGQTRLICFHSGPDWSRSVYTPRPIDGIDSA
jgi:hypothetical protein